MLLSSFYLTLPVTDILHEDVAHVVVHLFTREREFAEPDSRVRLCIEQ